MDYDYSDIFDDYPAYDPGGDGGGYDYDNGYDPGYDPDDLGDYDGNDPYGGDYNPTTEDMGGYESGGGGGFDWGSIPGFLRGLLPMLGGQGVRTGQGSVLGTGMAGLGAYGAYQNADELRAARDRAVAMSDPFAGQRGAYQGLLQRSYTDPDFFENNAVFRGLRSNAMDATNRQMSAQGYNMSGNQMQELNRTGINEGFRYAMPFQQGLAQLSGANIQPGLAGQFELQGTQAAGVADANAQAHLGNFLSNLFGNQGAGS